MKKRHKNKRHRKGHRFPAGVKDCFFPRKGHEFCYLGDASYKLGRHGEARGKGEILLDFYRRVDRAVRPLLLPKWFLRLLCLLENRGIERAGRLRRRCLGNVEIEWMGWKWERFRIRGRFNPKVESLAKKAGREIEDASHAGWFV
jgi:hypothetical protein